MKIYRFDSEVGREIENFGSVNFILSNIAHLKREALVRCIHLGADSSIRITKDSGLFSAIRL
ncbi:MAG: hypothetical protein P8X95_18580 [Anaerolineales bacterium]|jgi:hypothetical protein